MQLYIEQTPIFGFVCFFLEVKLLMKFGEHTEDISGPISVTDISGGLNEGSVVSGPVCVPDTDKTGSKSERIYWQFEEREIPRATTEEDGLSGWITVIYRVKTNLSLALQRFHNHQAKEGNFTCFYRPGPHGRQFSVTVGIYFPSE